MKRFSLIVGLIAVVAVTGCTTSFTDHQSGIVKTESGLLQGSVSDGIQTYFGVPYAEANQRFVPAEKVKPWSGVRSATEYGPIALQSSLTGFPVPVGPWVTPI